MSAAREFDDLALDYRLYRDFVEEKRQAGWSWNQIVSTLREAPLNAPIGDLDYTADARVEHLTPAADDQADDRSMLPQVPTAAEHKAMVEAQWKRGVAK